MLLRVEKLTCFVEDTMTHVPSDNAECIDAPEHVGMRPQVSVVVLAPCQKGGSQEERLRGWVRKPVPVHSRGK